MTGNKLNGITHFLKGKRSFCALLLAMIFLFTTSIAAYAVETPTADPPAGTYGGTQNVKLKTVAASVYYTTDGTVPTTASTLYTNPIAVASNRTIKAFATDGTVSSAVYTFEYIIFDGGSGTEEDPYLVATAEQLNNVRYHLGKHFKQTADINLNVAPYNEGEGWEPIGNDWYQFTGTFDGNGKIISKLTIKSTGSYVGLFGFADGSHIKNVKLEDVNVTGDYQVGGLVGDNKYGEITNSYATGAVTGTNYVGGLVGYNYWGTVTCSYATGAVDGNYCVGGLVAYNDCGEITNSYATGAVAGDLSVGGLVGLNFDYSDGTETITDSYASGDVTGTEGVGGLVGSNYGSICSITNSYATGAVTGIGDDVADIGGLVGYNEGVITNSYATGTVAGEAYIGGLVGCNDGKIANSYAAGAVTGKTDIGGLVGSKVNNSTVTNSYWDIDTSRTDSSAGGEGKTTADMNKQETYEGWDFNAIWSINGIRNNGYPFLVNNPPIEPENPLTITAATGGSITIGSSGNYAAGTVIPITATPASGYSFNKWTSTSGGTFANANSASTTYTMPANPATITATFTYNSSSGGSSGGGSSSTTPTGTQVTPSGRTTSQNGVTLAFPAEAVESDIRVQVKETALSGGMTLPNNSQLLSRVVDIVKDKSGNFLKPVTITLSFNNSGLDPDEYDIAIYYYDEDTGKWIALDNIRLNFKNGTISGDTNHFTKFAVIATPKTVKEEKPAKPVTPQPTVNIPSDISGHWAKDSIMKMINAGVISGYPDGTFKPDKAVTRAEFTVMIVKALNLETRAGKTFTDTASHWAKESISTAAAHGIISGYDENTFGPDDLITREQAAVIVSLATKLEAATGELSFTDSKAISPWAKPGVAAAFKGGFISGYPDGTFKPQGNTTRAEAVSLILKAI